MVRAVSAGRPRASIIATAAMLVMAVCEAASAAPTVTPSASTAPAGAPLVVTVMNDLAPSPFDWVGLYQTSAADGAYIAWRFMNGATVPPLVGLANAVLLFPGPVMPGAYEVRFFSNNTFTRLATSSTVTVSAAAPAVTPLVSSVSPGTAFDVVVTGGPGSPTDWAGLYLAGAADTGYVDWQFLNGVRTAPSAGLMSATLRFTPSMAGTYEVRLFSSNTYTRLATSAAVTVATPVTSITPAATTVAYGMAIPFTVAGGPGSATDWVGLYPTGAPDAGGYVNWMFLNGFRVAPSSGLSGATLQFPSVPPGTYEIRLFSSNTYARLATSSTVTVPAPVTTVTPEALTVSYGTPIRFTIAGGPGNATDWVGVYPTGAADAGGYLNWEFLNGLRVAPASGISSAMLQFPPVMAGTYEIRLFSSNTYTRLATSATVTVTAPVTTVTPSATTLSYGAPIRFTIAGGPGSATDWVGLFPTGAADMGYQAWQFLNGSTTPPASGLSGATLQFMPTMPGTYELRLFSSNTYTRLATSSVITVTNTSSVTMTSGVVTAAPIHFVVSGGPANPTDWVALYSTSASDLGYVDWQFLNGQRTAPTSGVSGASLWFSAPATAGSYEVRLFSNNTYVRLAASGPVTVRALPVPVARTFVSGLDSPVGFVQDPVDPTVQYVVQQTGRIRVVQSGVLLGTDFIDLSAQIVCCGEQGLLGLAFPPDYGTSHRFYLSFTGPNGNVVSRFTHSTGNRLVANPASRFDLRWISTGLTYIPQPFANHNGGNIVFGPDGYLYIGRGDGGAGNDPFNNAQNRQSQLGKMLRIDVNVSDTNSNGYVVPVDNPFVTDAPTYPEIWAFGMRNPWRFTFDDGVGGTGALVIADVGQGAWEEVDYEPPGNGGRNYGWVHREGPVPTPGVPDQPPSAGAPLTLTDPVFSYPHPVGISIIGGFVYRGTALDSGFTGRYVFADLNGRVWSLAFEPQPGGLIVSNLIEHTPTLGGNTIVAFGRDAQGELYIVAYDAGAILKITP